MSISYSGTFKRSAGVVSAIGKQLKRINLKPVKSIQVQFDPFHENAVAVRDFIHFISAPKIINTNLSCIIKTNVVCDRSEPFVKVNLSNNTTLKLLSANLTTLELLQVYNKNVLPFVKEDDIVPKQQKPTQGKKRLKK